MTRYALAIAAALAAMAAWSALMVNRGVERERASVERIGKKTDAVAKRARKAVAAKKPDEIRADLRKYCIDCER